MKNLVNITNQIIKERNLTYTPELFNNIFNEVKSTPKYIEHNKKRNDWLNSIKTTKKNYTLSFMNNYKLTNKGV